MPYNDVILLSVFVTDVIEKIKALHETSLGDVNKTSKLAYYDTIDTCFLFFFLIFYTVFLYFRLSILNSFKKKNY